MRGESLNLPEVMEDGIFAFVFGVVDELEQSVPFGINRRHSILGGQFFNELVETLPLRVVDGYPLVVLIQHPNQGLIGLCLLEGHVLRAVNLVVVRHEEEVNLLLKLLRGHRVELLQQLGRRLSVHSPLVDGCFLEDLPDVDVLMVRNCLLVIAFLLVLELNFLIFFGQVTPVSLDLPLRLGLPFIELGLELVGLESDLVGLPAKGFEALLESGGRVHSFVGF